MSESTPIITKFNLMSLKDIVSINRKIPNKKKINVDLSGTKYEVIT